MPQAGLEVSTRQRESCRDSREGQSARSCVTLPSGTGSLRIIARAKKLLAAETPASSLTALVVARAAAAHPEVHAYRNWRGQVVTHEHRDRRQRAISSPWGFGPEPRKRC